MQFDCCHPVSLSFTQFYECVWVGAGEPVLPPVCVGVCVCIESLVLLANYITTLLSFTPTHPPSLPHFITLFLCLSLSLHASPPHAYTNTHVRTRSTASIVHTWVHACGLQPCPLCTRTVVTVMHIRIPCILLSASGVLSPVSVFVICFVLLIE